MRRDDHTTAPLPAPPHGPPAPGAIDVESLFAGARELRLIFDGQEYRLSITRNSKLILTK